MNKLYIDTRDNKKIIIKLKTDKKDFVEESEASIDRAQTILPLILKILKKAQIDASSISEINVERGPGSFTGVRVGIAIANALSFSSGIKINGKTIGEIETPKY